MQVEREADQYIVIISHIMWAMRNTWAMGRFKGIV